MSASTLKDTMETPSVPMVGQKSYGSIDPSSESGHLGGSTAISGQSHGEVYELPQHVNCNGIMGRSRIIAIGMVLLLGFAISTTHSRWTGNNSYNRDRGRNPKDGRNTVLQETEGNSIGELTLEAANEYGANDRHALALYGLEMVIEPFRDTVISVTQSTAPADANGGEQYHWLLVAEDDDGVPRESTSPVVDSRGGSHLKVKVTAPGRSYRLVVKQIGMDGQVVAQGRATAQCKYVRRELRKLTAADRTAFFEALRVYYTISTPEAYRKYGSDFSNRIRITAIHNAQNYCYHNGMQFPLAHAAFNLVVERSLQRVNPMVSLPMWDFMVDSGRLGSKWPTSVVFSDEWFGSAVGSPDTYYQIKDGYFANVSSVFDPLDNVVDYVTSPHHNAYGYVSSPHDYTDLRGVVRTHSFCDMLGEVVFPKCGLLIKCFKNSESLYEWSTCMEHMVHASMHGLIGGGFNCNTDMEGFIKANPDYSRGLLTFALVYIVGAVWPSNTLMSDYNTCDSSCLHEQKVSCGCTCLTDPFAWTDHEVRVFMSSSMKVLSKCSGSHLWMDFNKEFEWPLGFKQDGKRLPEDRTLFLLRTMMVIACEPGSIGAMGTGSSPLDPIFWVLHPVFEKALHVVNLCPRYADTFDFTWVASSCFGSDYKDQLPFTEKVLGLGNGTEFLTNRDLVKLFHPSSGRLTYMYDDFLSWGTCHDWDPCPECSSDA